MTFSAEIEMFLVVEFGLVCKVCNILGYLARPTVSLTQLVLETKILRFVTFYVLFYFIQPKINYLLSRLLILGNQI